MLLPEHWECSKNDKTLLKVVSDMGIQFLGLLSNNLEYGFEDIEITTDVAFKRVEEVCEFFKEFQQQAKGVKKFKRDIPPYQSSESLGMINQLAAAKQESGTSSNREFQEPKKKPPKNLLQKDEQGNIKYPIVINASLQVVNLGTIEHKRPLFHNEKNLFPIGFKSIREHNSQIRAG